MRNALISALLIIFFTSLDYPDWPSYINLRQPIYLVINEGFWFGCANDPAGYEACRMNRIEQINEGANDWFKHFEEAARPQVVIVYSEADLPPNTKNNPIYLKIDEGFCGMATKTQIAAACYTDTFFSPPAIVFNLPENVLSSHFAHELGHALDREHNDMPKDTYSVMSYTHDSGYVVPIDLEILCKMHPECPPHEEVW